MMILNWWRAAKETLLRPRVLRLVIYSGITLYLVLCGVVYFAELPISNATDQVLTEQLRDTYEGYTVYLTRAAVLVGIALGLFASAIAHERGLGFGLAMLVTGHLFNAILFIIALPPVRAGGAEFTSGLYYHAAAMIPAAFIWTVLAVSDWARANLLRA